MQITYNNLKLMFVTHAIKTRNDKHRARYAIKIRFYDLHNVQPNYSFYPMIKLLHLQLSHLVTKMINRTRSNAADSKDVDVILSPQRMSFGNGCAGSKIPPTSDNSNSNTKRLNGLLPKTKFDKNSERTRDPDREKHLQKINGNYSGNREQIRKAIRDLHENRDRNKDGSAPTKVSKYLIIRRQLICVEFCL